MIQTKRVYDEPAAGDGYRVLVDRLWPRGLSKEKASVDLWLKEVAPTTELRKWFGHEDERYEEFRRRYREELGANPAAEELTALIAEHDPVSLLYSAKNPHNQAAVLLEYLQERPR
jgi:DNA-3-methyladenine glycosylase